MHSTAAESLEKVIPNFPKQDSPHVVLRPATCTSPEERAYYDERTQNNCYGPRSKMHCPYGWEEFGVTDRGDHGCQPGARLPKCRKSIWFRKPKWQCCLQNNGRDVDCPPQFCKAKSNEQSCYEELKAHCLKNPGQLASAECREWVRRDGVRSRPEVFDAVKKHCTQKKYEKDTFCACVNAHRDDLCTNDNCWARKNLAMKDLALCAAPQCKNPASGTWYPSGDLTDCVDICAPLLEIKNSDLSAEQLELLFQCGEQFSAEDRKKYIEPHQNSAKARENGGTGGSGGEQTEENPDLNEKVEESTKSWQETLQEWPVYIWIVAATALLLVIVMLVYIFSPGRGQATTGYTYFPPQQYAGF